MDDELLVAWNKIASSDLRATSLKLTAGTLGSRNEVHPWITLYLVEPLHFDDGLCSEITIAFPLNPDSRTFAVPEEAIDFARNALLKGVLHE